MTKEGKVLVLGKDTDFSGCLGLGSIKETKKFVEDNKYIDMKIIIGLICSVLGAISHFYPIPFPQNKILIGYCIVGYAICATDQHAFILPCDSYIRKISSTETSNRRILF